jgi:hypothetical protein
MLFYKEQTACARRPSEIEKVNKISAPFYAQSIIIGGPNLEIYFKILRQMKRGGNIFSKLAIHDPNNKLRARAGRRKWKKSTNFRHHFTPNLL